MRLARLLTILLLASSCAKGAAIKILAIGDSLTQEYASESWIGIGTNIKNWPELIQAYRPTEMNLGTNALAYNDWRTSGASANFAFPGQTAADWVNILYTTTFGRDYSTRSALIGELPTSNVAVILLGANDLSNIYSSLYNNTESPTALSTIVSRLATIHDFIRGQRPTLPIVISTVADVGATPDRAASYPDLAKRLAARAKIASLNQSIMTMAQGKGATVARIDRLTDRAWDEVPFQVNGTVFTLAGASGNPAGRVFSQDNFHPAIVGQLLIANEVISACATATGQPLTVFQNREILTLLGFVPDAPYNTWKAGYPGLGAPTADDDLDGIPNLVEYTLGLSPKQRSAPMLFPASMNGTLKFATSAVGLRYASLTVMESANLSTWSAVPTNRITVGGDGMWTVAPSGAKKFYRLKAETRP